MQDAHKFKAEALERQLAKPRQYRGSVKVIDMLKSQKLFEKRGDVENVQLMEQMRHEQEIKERAQHAIDIEAQANKQRSDMAARNAEEIKALKQHTIDVLVRTRRENLEDLNTCVVVAIFIFRNTDVGCMTCALHLSSYLA